MSILCGTDFSTGTRDAIRVATALARRRNEALHLVHAIDLPDSVEWDDDSRERARRVATERLGAEAKDARAPGAAGVAESVEAGPAHEVLVSKGAGEQASLIVVGAVGARSPAPIGRTAERVAESARFPVLVVRHATPFEAWLRGERSLKVVVADDLTPRSEAALRWTAALRALGPCEIVVAHVFGLLGEKSRLGIPGSLYSRVPDLERANLSALRRHAAPLVGTQGVSYRVEATLGRPAEPLLAIAAEESADLVVVGTRRRTGLARAWHGSSSHVVVTKSIVSVACIPMEQVDGAEPILVPALQRVLVTTDFSSVANRAVGYAYGIVAPGGTVHLLHVDEDDDPGRKGIDPLERLRRLVPEQSSGKQVETRLEVVTDACASAAIAAAAERLDVDVVCMGTHGRTGVERVVLGSVAQEVLERCRRQVLLVPPRRSEA